MLRFSPHLRQFHFPGQSSTGSSPIGRALHVLGISPASASISSSSFHKSPAQYLSSSPPPASTPPDRLTPSMLKQAYLRRAVVVHPDTNPATRNSNKNMNVTSANANNRDSTREFQELGEALSVAMSYVQQQQQRLGFYPSMDVGGDDLSSDGRTIFSIQQNYLRNLEFLAQQQQQQQQHHERHARNMMNGSDPMQNLQQVVSSCSKNRNSFRQIHSSSDSLAERLCGRRSFDSLNLFSVPPSTDGVNLTAASIIMTPPSTSIEECSKAYTLFITILPNIVARLRRSMPNSTNSKSMSDDDFQAIRTAHKFGFQPCVLIGGLIIHPGEYCGLMKKDDGGADPGEGGEDAGANDQALRSILVHHNFQLMQPSVVSTSMTPLETEAAVARLMDQLRQQPLSQLAQRLLRVHPELICVVGLKSLITGPATTSNTNHTINQNSFQKRTGFLDRITPTFLDWQVQSARRLRTENRIVVACRSLSLEIGAILPELSCVPDLNMSNGEAEEFATKIEEVISMAAASSFSSSSSPNSQSDEDQQHQTNDSALTEQHRRLLSDAGEKLDSRPHPLSPHQLRRHMISCILVDEKQFDILSATASKDCCSSSVASTKNNKPKTALMDALVIPEDIVEQQEHGTSHRELHGEAIVSRSRTACRIEDQQFEVVIKLAARSPVQTANNIIAAVELLHSRCNQSYEAMPLAVADREGSLVRCISRVFAMSAAEEQKFWEQIRRRSEFLKEHECRISNIDVHFVVGNNSNNSNPSSKDNNHQNAGSRGASNNSYAPRDIGWCESQPDGEKVTINKAAIQNNKSFDDWIEDAVAQCTLSRQANLLAQRFSLFYVNRERNLLLPHYIAFLNRYIESAARSVIELPSQLHQKQQNQNGLLKMQNQASSSSSSLITPIELVVGHHLEMKQDGSLVVPWDFDLSLLVTLLGDHTYNNDKKSNRVLTE